MKELLLSVLLFLSLPVCVTPQTEPTKCLFDQSLLVQPQIPNYLQPWWNSVRYGQYAVVYIDFKDGRYVNGNDTTQPFYDYQLQWVLQNGVADAAGEMGLVNEQTIIPVGSKYMKASKYTWFDRWNMLFVVVGVPKSLRSIQLLLSRSAMQTFGSPTTYTSCPCQFIKLSCSG